jgi:transposase-like protein
LELRLDSEGEFSEGRRELLSGIGIQIEFIVTAADVLNKGVLGADRSCGAEPFETTPRLPAVFTELTFTHLNHFSSGESACLLLMQQTPLPPSDLLRATAVAWGSRGLMLVELSVVEQRYHAAMESYGGVPVVEAAERYGVFRKTAHAWVRQYRQEGLPGLVDRSHHPHHHPRQLAAEIEAPSARAGPARITPVASRSTVYKKVVCHAGHPGKASESYLRGFQGLKLP